MALLCCVAVLAALAACGPSGTNGSPVASLANGEEYHIDIAFADDGTFTAEERAAFSDAAARWSEVIVGDVPDVTLPALPANSCGYGEPALASTRVDTS